LREAKANRNDTDSKEIERQEREVGREMEGIGE
jgi:hypothetical protein